MAVASTAAQKILARACGRESVAVGELVFPQADLIVFHDGYGSMLADQLDRLGVTRFVDPERVVIATDHHVNYENSEVAERGRVLRDLAERFGVERFYDVGQAGHGNIFPIERGLVAPGMLVFHGDGNGSNFGAVGALTLYTGPDTFAPLATGSIWTVVPPTVQIELEGELSAHTTAMDLGIQLASELGQRLSGGDLDGVVVELRGDGIRTLGIHGCVTLCNLLTIAGALSVMVEQPADVVERLVIDGFEPAVADAGADLAWSSRYSIAQLDPQIVAPPRDGRRRSISDVAGTTIDQAVIGSCASGMYDDLALAASVLDGRRVASGVRLIVTPATEDTFDRLLDDGIISIFRRAGAIITQPGCGPCAGGRLGALAPGEVSIGTLNANGTGRLGSVSSDLWLASPLTVAASAVAGVICDPRELP
jgi:homoaconitase/3-isopropylmalate dehydratase large subunit